MYQVPAQKNAPGNALKSERPETLVGRGRADMRYR